MHSLSASTFETVYSAVMLVLILCPSPLRLLWLWIQHLRGERFNPEKLPTGILIHIFNSLISPGIPGYLFYIWSKCGPGCGSGVVFIFILPPVWLLFFVGNSQLKKEKNSNALPTKSTN
jgi:hypothetical protein